MGLARARLIPNYQVPAPLSIHRLEMGLAMPPLIPKLWLPAPPDRDGSGGQTLADAHRARATAPAAQSPTEARATLLLMPTSGLPSPPEQAVERPHTS